MKKRGPFTEKLVVNIVTLSCVVTALQAFAMNLFFEMKITDAIDRDIETFVDTYSANVSDSLDSFVLELDRMAKIILGNAQIQQALQRKNGPSYNELQQLQDDAIIENTIFSFTSLRDSTYIFLADRAGNLVVTPGGLASTFNPNIFDDAYIAENAPVFEDGSFLLVPPGNTRFRSYGERPAYLFIRALHNLQSKEVEAYILVMFPESLLLSKLEPADAMRDQMRVSVSGDDVGQIARYPSGEPDGADGPAREMHVSSHRSEVTGWTSTVEVATAYLQSSFTGKNVYIIPLLITMTVGAVLLSLYIFQNVIRPVGRILQGMKAVETGDFSVSISLGAHSRDMESLFNGFNHMVKELDSLTQAVVEEKILLKDAQVAALQYQINPHFLYNTLQTMEAIAEVRDVPEVQVMAKALGDLLRYNIRGALMVTVEQELRHIETYLKIERIRFGEALRYVISTEGPAGGCMIPKFVIQPLVENCIVHGARNVSGEMRIQIEARVRDGVLRLSVYNNGAPIAEETLAAVARGLDAARADDRGTASEGPIGLLNVHRRILHKFGDGYGVRIERGAENTGTIVTLTMPEVKSHE